MKWSDFWFYVACLLAGIILGLLGGCSAVQKVSDAAIKVKDQGQAIRVDVVDGKAAIAAGDLPTAIAEFDSIDGHAVAIVDIATLIQKQIPKLDDAIPWWANLLKWVLVVTVLGGIVFLLWRFNLLLLAEKVIQKIVDLIAKAIGA